MEFKTLALEVKATEDGEIQGYGSVFDVVDQSGDIVAAGAFKRSLAMGRKPKMLLQHNAADVIGVWDEVAEDDRGLRVKGKVLAGVTKAREALELVKAGALDGLSIGYRVVKSLDRNGRRVILDADLWEVSLVTFPMNEAARIDAVKASGLTERELERVLTQDAGFSRSVARKLMAGGFGAVKAMQDAGDGIEELAQALKLRCNL